MKSLRLQSVIITVLTTIWQLTFAKEILQTLDGSVGAQNFTYYKLARSGHMRIELMSLSGDADLYVSDVTASPSWRNFKQESVTCGLDAVEIPASYKRPVGIGIYGHFIHDVSTYKLTIIHVSKHDADTYDQMIKKFSNYKEAVKFHECHGDELSRKLVRQTISSGSSTDDDEENEGSILWQIIVTVLKIFFEIIL